MFSRLIAFSPGLTFPQSLSIFWWLIATVILGHIFAKSGLWDWLWRRTPALAQGFAYATAFSIGLILAPDAGRAFIYFQF
jgi:alginate O-acetyltransferase complex protein AlgI